MLTLIKNVFPVYEDFVSSKVTSILLKDGIILDKDFVGDVPINAEVIDGCGGFCLPGFIDLHVHGGGGCDFMDSTVEAFKTITETHLKYGTTSLLPTAMAATQEDLLDFISTYHSYLKCKNQGAKTLGLHLEGPYFSNMNDKSKGAQNSDVLRKPSKDEILEILDAAKGSIVRWDAAPELDNIDLFTEIMKQNNIICSAAHSSANGEEATKGFNIGFSHVTHFYNAVTTYRKVEQEVFAGIVESAYLNDNVSLELICDGKHIPKECLQLALKIKGAKKVSAITDAMRLAGTDEKYGKLGSNEKGTDVVVDNGVAKLLDLSSYAGSIATMDRCLRVLNKKYDIPLNISSIMLSLAPAEFLGISDKIGSIKEGKVADLIIVDNDLYVKNIIKNGILVNN